MTLAETTARPAGRAHPPSGDQLTLRHGSQSVTVVEVGGGIRSYVSDGRPLLDGYELDERCTGARGQLAGCGAPRAVCGAPRAVCGARRAVCGALGGGSC